MRRKQCHRARFTSDDHMQQQGVDDSWPRRGATAGTNKGRPVHAMGAVQRGDLLQVGRSDAPSIPGAGRSDHCDSVTGFGQGGGTAETRSPAEYVAAQARSGPFAHLRRPLPAMRNLEGDHCGSLHVPER